MLHNKINIDKMVFMNKPFLLKFIDIITNNLNQKYNTFLSYRWRSRGVALTAKEPHDWSA